MEREVDNQVAAPAETRIPNLHRAKRPLIKSADGRVATVALGRRKTLSHEKRKEPPWLRPAFSWKAITLEPRHARRPCKQKNSAWQP